jgi:hypothetical protein
VLDLAQRSHQTSTVLEHPAVTRLFDQFVIDRDYQASEEVLQQIVEGGLMREYQDLVPKSYTWKLLCEDGMASPSIRGGHAMCAYNGTTWLFGGSKFTSSTRAFLAIIETASDDRSGRLDDFWRGSLQGNVLSWVQIQRRGAVWPEFRGSHLMTATESRV